MPSIYVDADACPVREECLRVARRHDLKVFIVSDGGIRPVEDSGIEFVFVKPGLDAADHWISESIGSNDIVVTGDIPLAAACIKRGATAIKPNGETLDDSNIGPILGTRDLFASLRETGAITGGPRPFRKEDRSRFISALEGVVGKVFQKDKILNA